MKINSFYRFSKKAAEWFGMKVHCEYGTILEAVRKKSDEFRTAQPSPSILPEAGAFYKKKRQIQAAG